MLVKLNQRQYSEEENCTSGLISVFIREDFVKILKIEILGLNNSTCTIIIQKPLE